MKKPPPTIAEHHREKAFEALKNTTGRRELVMANALVSIAHSLASLSRDVAYLRDRATPHNTGPG